jgi:hypothetical protein
MEGRGNKSIFKIDVSCEGAVCGEVFEYTYVH